MPRVFRQKRNGRRLVQFDVANFLTAHRWFLDSFDLIQPLLGRDPTDALAHIVHFARIVQGTTRT